MQHASIDRCSLYMVDFKSVLQLLIYILLIVFSIDCCKGKGAKKIQASKFAGTVKSSSSSSSSSAQTPRREPMKPVQSKPTGTSEVGVLPTQLREIMEAERMAKQQKGYDNFDIELDLDDVKTATKK